MKTTYEIKVYVSPTDYQYGNGELIEEHIPSKRVAFALAKKEFNTGFYHTVKVQSSDREFIKVFSKNNNL